MRQECLKMLGFRGIERVKGVHHTTVINSWVRQVAPDLPDAPEPDLIPEVGEVDELQTKVCLKKTKSGYGQWHPCLGHRKPKRQNL